MQRNHLKSIFKVPHKNSHSSWNILLSLRNLLQLYNIFRIKNSIKRSMSETKESNSKPDSAKSKSDASKNSKNGDSDTYSLNIPQQSAKNVTTVGRFFSKLCSSCTCFTRCMARAAKERKLYRQECLYTVADSYPEDVKVIEETKPPIIWILATPGAPVTELMVRLCEVYKWHHLSLGALLQKELALVTGHKDEVHHLLHRGVSLPRAFIFEMIRRQMANICRGKSHKGFIFTDYPSTLTQMKELQEYVCKPDFILYLKFSERLTQENLNIYLRFQVRASKVLRKLQPDVHVISQEQTKKFRREIDKIYAKFGGTFKVIESSISVEDVCRDIMKWIERASIMHNIIPPLFVEPPLHDHGKDVRNELYKSM